MMKSELIKNEIEKELNIKLPDIPQPTKIYEGFKYTDDPTKDPNIGIDGKKVIIKIICLIIIIGIIIGSYNLIN